MSGGSVKFQPWLQVRSERLRHPSGVFGLRWSPSGLQQDAPQYEHLQVSNFTRTIKQPGWSDH